MVIWPFFIAWCVVLGLFFFQKKPLVAFAPQLLFSCQVAKLPLPPPSPPRPPKFEKIRITKWQVLSVESVICRGVWDCSKLHPLLFYSPHSDHAQCVKLCLQDDRCWWQKNTLGIFKVWVDKWVLSWEFQICASIQWLLLHQGSSEFIYLRTDMYFTTRASRLSLDWMAGCWEFW